MKSLILKLTIRTLTLFISLPAFSISPEAIEAFRAIEADNDQQLSHIFMESHGKLSPDTRDPKGLTFLHRACMKSPRSAHFLLGIGANPYLQTTHEKQTPLHLACKNGYLSVVRALILQKSSYVNQFDCLSNTALHYCILGITGELSQTRKSDSHKLRKQVFYEIMKCLVANGCDPSITNSFERTPHHLALKSESSEISNLSEPLLTKDLSGD